ncbi:hypothetical protein [Pseudomonas hunanensis]
MLIIHLSDVRGASSVIFGAYDIREGCAAGYYPQSNPLKTLWHRAEHVKVPAARSVPVTLDRAQSLAADPQSGLPAEYPLG